MIYIDKKIKFETSIEVTNEVLNNNFHRARLKVLHDGVNKNGSNIPLDAIEDAMESIKNTPILAFIERDKDGEAIGFGGHESTVTIKEKDGELYFDEFFEEIPIGVIPESNNAIIEEIDGKNYLICDCFIWKSYSNEAYDMLVENKKNDVSCEIEAKSIDFEDDGTMTIKKFQFLGVTVIGLPPGMEGAEIDMNVNFSKYNKEQFTSKVEELNTYLKKELKNSVKEAKKMENNKKMEFGLSIENLKNAIRSQLDNKTIQKVDYWGDSYCCPEYYLITILPEEKIVILEDANEWYKYYGVSYSLSGDEVLLDFDTKKEYVNDWREKQVGETVVAFEKEDNLKDVILEKFSQKENEIVGLKEELVELKTFKANYEEQVKLEEITNEVNNVISKFSFKEDEISELRDKAINGEMDIATFELNLKALCYDKTLSTKSNFSKENSTPNKIKVKAVKVEEEDDVLIALNEMKAKFCKTK